MKGNGELIEFVVVGSSVVKRKVIDYLKSEGMLFESDHLYKLNCRKKVLILPHFIVRIQDSCFRHIQILVCGVLLIN